MLTSVLPSTEEDLSGFSQFLQGLTWDKVLPAALTLLVSLILVRILTSLFAKALRRSKLDQTLQPLIRGVFKTLLLSIAILISAGTLGVDVSALVAILSVVSLAVSLAVQDFLSILVGGLVILTSHPFRVGDYVELSGTAGTVQRIGLTYTDLLTPSNQEVHVPNSQVSSSTVTNYTAAGTRRLEITVSAAYDVPPEQVKAALLTACRLPGVLPDPVPEAHVSQYGSGAISYVLRAWATAEQYWDIYYAVLETVKTAFDEAGIPMAYPHWNVHMQ